MSNVTYTIRKREWPLFGQTKWSVVAHLHEVVGQYDSEEEARRELERRLQSSCVPCSHPQQPNGGRHDG